MPTWTMIPRPLTLPFTTWFTLRLIRLRVWSHVGWPCGWPRGWPCGLLDLVNQMDVIFWLRVWSHVGQRDMTVRLTVHLYVRFSVHLAVNHAVFWGPTSVFELRYFFLTQGMIPRQPKRHDRTVDCKFKCKCTFFRTLGGQPSSFLRPHVGFWIRHTVNCQVHGKTCI